MGRRPFAVALAALAGLAALAPAAGAGSPFGATAEQQHAAGLELGRAAYEYGFPLLEWRRTRATDLRRSAPVNVLANTTTLATAADRSVVAPNVDTLYSIAQLDLGREPVVLSVPKMGSRYFVFQFLDPYTNVVGYVGHRLNGGGGGRWAITWRGHRGGRLPKGVRRFESPYRRLWVIGRTLVRGGRDLPAARALMARYRLAPLSRVRGREALPAPVVRREIRDTSTLPKGLAFLDALGAALRENPPPGRDTAVLRRLREAGIGPGLRPGRAGLPAPVLDGLAAGVDAEAVELPGRTRLTIFRRALDHGGWYDAGAAIGRYGTDYELRAQIALVGLGANTAEEAAYPIALTDSAGELLTGTRRYRLVFAPAQLPPVDAFWSLTLYDIDGYLAPNAPGISAVGDSPPPLRRRADGSVVVVLQGTPPAEDDVNWIPTPQAAAFRLNLRLYEPRARFLRGAWTPPPVERLG